MKANSNWDKITASNGGQGILPEGGYAVRIDAVEDHTDEAKPYLALVYNPYLQDEGRFFYGADAQDWQRTIKIYLTSDFGWQRYKMLVECIEQSDGNAGFRYDASRDGAEQTLAGKWVGMVLRHRLYTGQRGKAAGKDRTAIDLQHITTVQAIKGGDFPAPVTKDDRDPAAVAADAPITDAELAGFDLPF